jgi:hypothetical protein
MRREGLTDEGNRADHDRTAAYRDLSEREARQDLPDRSREVGETGHVGYEPMCPVFLLAWE